MALHPEAEQRQSSEQVRAESDPIRRALQENEDWYQDLVEHSQDLLCIHDLEGRLLSVNPTPARILGYSVEEVLQIPMRELIVPEFRGEFDAYMKLIAEKGEARGFLALMTRSGERRIWEYHNTLRTAGVASPIVRGMAHDITEQRRAEKELRELNEAQLAKACESERIITEQKLFRALIDQSNDGIEVVEPKTLRFLDTNQKACSELGYNREELLSMTLWDINPVITETSIAEMREELRRSGSLVIETLHRRKDGITFPVEVSMKRVLLDREYVIAISRDLTERKMAETRLRESQERYRAVHDQSPVGICWVESRTGRLLGVNPKYCEILGRTEQDLLAHDFQSLTHPDDLPGNLEKLRQLVDGEVRHYEMEKRYLRPDGSVRWAEVEVVAMWPEGGEPLWHLAIVQDVTERKRAEEALREAKEFSDSLIRTANVIILSLDLNGNITLLNRAAEEITGYTFSELSGKNWSILVPRDRFPEAWEEHDRLVAGTAGQTYENPIITKTGEERHIAWRNNLLRVHGKVVATISFGIDITERKRAQEALQRSEENYRMFISQSSEGIFREDLDAPVSIDLPEAELVQHILHDSYMAECNDALARMYGLTSGKEFVGRRLEEMVPPDDPHNIELTRHFIRSGFRVLERESHEVDIYGNSKVFLNSMIGTVENGMLVRSWGIQRDVTEKVKAEEARQRAEEALRQNLEELRKVTAELQQAKDKLSEEKLYLEQAIDVELGFGEIIGRSSALKEVMQKVAKVAPSDATVLLLGDTGTGKELVARALHQMSHRKEASFIKVNCAAIPSGLLESELFGHEKGAFTGAVAKKLGRLELADKGTLFLDEIGEIPLSLQPKLLRVLQDQEFERLGGTQTLKVSFRLLAATNRDLLASVGQKEFRSDLYYRLNVFPIRIPPLRDRREDIPLLVEHFVRKYAARMGKTISSVPTKTMEALVQWIWPGNIRELENFIERSVILTPGSVLQPPLGELRAEHVEQKTANLREKERERILRVLHECNGQLGGPNGAAARLGLKRTTLQSKLSQLGISPKNYRA